MSRLFAIAATAITALTIASAKAQEKPQYGGTLSVGPISVTLSPQSWDPADWNYKTAEDSGMYFDRLFVADLSKATHLGGKHLFKSDGYLPSDAIKGDLAETWRWLESPLRLEIKLRRGVMFPEKAGVMAARELTAEDVAYSYNRMIASPKKISEFLDYIDKIEAADRHTVVIYFRRFQEDWAYRFGWGTYSSIFPKELIEAGINDWKKATGSGPFLLTDHLNGNSQTYSRNPIYWGRETIDGTPYQLPFLEKLIVRTIKDEAARYTALRTGKLDMLQFVQWSAVDELKRNAPQLKWARWLSHGGRYIAMRVDNKPFDDIRVRRALNMAVNKQEIVSSFYGGNAEVFAYPMHRDYIGYYEPLESMPEAVRELFVYNPEKAKKLLAEAGYPKGFSFKAQVCTCSPELMDLAPLLVAYLERIGVKMELEPLEQGPLFSLLRNGKNAPGFIYANSHGSPTQSLRKNFVKNQYTNNSHWEDPAIEKKLETVYSERDESVRQKAIKEMTRDILEKAPYLWLPSPYIYAAWWPWVKNYGGEIYAGGFWSGPIYSRVWVDQELKKKMGF